MVLSSGVQGGYNTSLGRGGGFEWRDKFGAVGKDTAKGLVSDYEGK